MHWNHEAGDLEVWLEAPAGVAFDSPVQVAPRPEGVIESDEVRSVEFELSWNGDAEPTGPITLRGFAAYAVCEGEGGTCRYLRQDFELVLNAESTTAR